MLLLGTFFFFFLEMNSLVCGNGACLGSGVSLPVSLSCICYYLSWLGFTADFSGDQNRPVSALLCFVVLHAHEVFAVTRAQDAAATKDQPGSPGTPPPEGAAPQARDGPAAGGRERLGEKGPAGPPPRQRHHQPGLQGPNTAFQSAGHSRQGNACQRFKLVAIRPTTLPVKVKGPLRGNMFARAPQGPLSSGPSLRSWGPYP